MIFRSDAHHEYNKLQKLTTGWVYRDFTKLKSPPGVMIPALMINKWNPENAGYYSFNSWLAVTSILPSGLQFSSNLHGWQKVTSQLPNQISGPLRGSWGNEVKLPGLNIELKILSCTRIRDPVKLSVREVWIVCLLCFRFIDDRSF